MTCHNQARFCSHFAVARAHTHEMALQRTRADSQSMRRVLKRRVTLTQQRSNCRTYGILRRNRACLHGYARSDKFPSISFQLFRHFVICLCGFRHLLVQLMNGICWPSGHKPPEIEDRLKKVRGRGSIQSAAKVQTSADRRTSAVGQQLSCSPAPPNCEAFAGGKHSPQGRGATNG